MTLAGDPAIHPTDPTITSDLMPRPWNPRLPLDPELWLKPQVVQIASAVRLDRWAVVGRLFLLWYHAQVKATEAGVLEGKSSSWVNALVDCAGFAEAMAAAGWLVIEQAGVRIPDFDAFVSKRAVRRIEKSDWQAGRRSRTADTAPPMTTECGPNVDGMKPYSDGATTPTPSPGGRRSGKRQPPKGGPRFDRFWAAYPRKEKRIDAMRAWDKAGLESDEAILLRILEAVGRQAVSEQWTKDGGGFIPHPSSYINGRRWEDEPVRTGSGQPVRTGARVVAGAGEYGKKPSFGSSPPPPPDPPKPPPQATLF